MTKDGLTKKQKEYIENFRRMISRLEDHGVGLILTRLANGKDKYLLLEHCIEANKRRDHNNFIINKFIEDHLKRPSK